MDHTQVSICMKSNLNNEDSVYEYQGRYRQKGNIHCITYTDRQEDAETKVRIDAGPGSMVLLRAGAVRTRMLFDPQEDTSVSYEIGGFRTSFILHTKVYELKILSSGIWIHLEYSLREENGSPVSSALQDLQIEFR